MAVKPPPKTGSNSKGSEIDRFINKGGKTDKEKKELMMKTTIGLPPELIQKIDKYCKQTYQTRTAFIIQAILNELKKDEW